MDVRSHRSFNPADDVYTDVRGLQNLKTEENQDAALKKIAQQFESLFLHEMLKSMRKANEVFEEDSLLNGGDTGFYRDMYDQQLSLSLAQKGTGLADSIYRQLQRQYEPQVDSDGQDKLQSPARSLPVAAPRTAVHAAVESAPAPVESAPVQTASPAAAETAVFDSAQDFITAILPHAKAAARALGVNPLMLTAQAALETGWGKFVIRDGGGASTHNLFNIKADRAWGGERAQVNTLEYRDGAAVKERAQFRSYGSFAESFADYVEFLKNNPRYQNALEAPGADEEFANNLQRAGYATDPQYAQKILAIAQQLRADPALSAASED